MSNQTERDITGQIIRSRFDAYMLEGRRQEAMKLVDLAWEMGLKLLAAQMVIAMANKKTTDDKAI